MCDENTAETHDKALAARGLSRREFAVLGAAAALSACTSTGASRPGEGDLAFAPIFAALRQQNYAGDYGIEPFVYVPDGPTCAARAIGYLRGLLEGLNAND